MVGMVNGPGGVAVTKATEIVLGPATIVVIEWAVAATSVIVSDQAIFA